MKQVLVIIWATVIALALMYTWWSKGRYEIVTVDGSELFRLDKNTGKTQRCIFRNEYEFSAGKAILKREKWEQAIE